MLASPSALAGVARVSARPNSDLITGEHIWRDEAEKAGDGGVNAAVG